MFDGLHHFVGSSHISDDEESQKKSIISEGKCHFNSFKTVETAQNETKTVKQFNLIHYLFII